MRNPQEGDGQPENLERVSVKIARHIKDFVRARVDFRMREFHMEDLVQYVQKCVPGTAPDSASRVLRDLRLRGALDYEVISRRNSHYRIILGPGESPQPPFNVGHRVRLGEEFVAYAVEAASEKRAAEMASCRGTILGVPGRRAGDVVVRWHPPMWQPMGEPLSVAAAACVNLEHDET